MTKGKKYSYRTVQSGASWTAEILRRKTSVESIVSKKQDDFKTEAEAISWAEEALNEFRTHQAERNKRDAVSREQKKIRPQSDEA